MNTTPNQGEHSSQEPQVSVCNHTETHKNGSGELLGTWIEIPIDDGILVKCCVCSLQYGVIKQPSKDDVMLKAYLQQQSRRSCPGCGEDPFLG